MTKYGLRTWMILLSLAPTLLIGLLLGTYFTVSRFHQLEDELIEKGINLIEPLAIASEDALIHNSREQLMRLIGISHRKYSPDVRSITVFSSDGNVFVSSNFNRQFDRLKLPQGHTIPDRTTVDQQGEFIILRTPIYPDFSQHQGQPLQAIGYMAVQLDRSSTTLLQHHVSFVTVVIVMTGVLLCLIFTFRLVRKVSGPITQMAVAIDNIRKGKLQTQLTGNHIGELDELRSGINAMSKSIMDHQDELQQNIEQATQELRETLEQIEIQNVEMDLAKRRAQQAARLKSEFLANMSHELRTPLNGVLGFSNQLMKSKLTGAQHEQIETIHSSAHNLLRIINDILDLSKLEAGKLTLEQTPFIFREALDEVLLLLAPDAYKKSLDVALTIEKSVPDDLMGDATRIKQVITNLLSNAIKFTDHGSIQIHIGVDEIDLDQVRLKIRIQDTGVGISEPQQKALFKAFAQADASISRRFGGTGLGLVITKRLLQEMGGDIRVDSRLGVGSTFHCTLCCQISPIALSEHGKEDPIVGQSILLYESQPHTLECLERTMQDWLMNITPCKTEEQWQSLTENGDSFDAVLLNIDHLDQQSLHYELARLERITRHTVLMTAFIHKHDLDSLTHYRNMKISYLRKPVSQLRLLDTLKKQPLAHDSHESPSPVETEMQTQLPLKALAVDDNPANLKLLSTLLHEKITVVAEACNGEEAIAKAKHESFDIIFMDIQMPNINGIMATELIRQGEHNKTTPVVAVTAHALPEERASLLASGMDDYLTKPIDEALLDKILKHWSNVQTLDVKIKHPLVDWNQALEQAGGRSELAKEMLVLFMQALPDSFLAIQTAWQAQDTQTLKAQVHRLHGACCYSGVPRLKNIANELESLLKQDYTLEEVEPEYFELCDLIEQLIVQPPKGLQLSSTTVASA